MRTLKSCHTCNRPDDVGTGGGDELAIIQGSVLTSAGTGTTRLQSDKDGRFGEDAFVLEEIDHTWLFDLSGYH